jgi:hypothetical protein
MTASILARVDLDEGPHRRISIFAGADREHRANCGQLVMREDEAATFLRMLADGGADVVRPA